MIHSFLFFIEQNFIFRYQYRDNLRFDLLPYSDGAKEKNFTSEFWRDWELDSCYCPEDSVDFAFLTDNSFCLETPSRYKVLNPTQFCTCKRIQDIFCKCTLDYPNVIIVYKERQEQVLSKHNLINDQLRTFYLTIPYPTPQDFLQPRLDGDYNLGSFLDDERKRQQQEIDKHHMKKLFSPPQNSGQ